MPTDIPGHIDELGLRDVPIEDFRGGRDRTIATKSIIRRLPQGAGEDWLDRAQIAKAPEQQLDRARITHVYLFDGFEIIQQDGLKALLLQDGTYRLFSVCDLWPWVC